MAHSFARQTGGERLALKHRWFMGLVQLDSHLFLAEAPVPSVLWGVNPPSRNVGGLPG